MEPSVFSLMLIVIAIPTGIFGWLRMRATQKRVLANTEMILAILQSVHGFHSEAALASDLSDLNVAAGIAQEELEVR